MPSIESESREWPSFGDPNVTGSPIPELVKFGTSTWTYEGWQGLVYRESYPKGRFKEDCLAEYARYRYQGRLLFRTVGLDHSFYRPPTAGLLAHYARQLPPGFEVCSKVWEELTVPRFADHPRYGVKAGRLNPRFLDADLFIEQVLAPYRKAFSAHTGPFIFEFQRTGIEPEEFLQRLDCFLGQLPKGFVYAIETRNPRLLGPDYFALLRTHGAAHVYNHWTSMPPLADQHRRLGGLFPASVILLRLLPPPGMSHGEAVTWAQPYNRIIRPLPEMRGQALALIQQAVAENRGAYVLVNNRAEGCAPLTIQALVDQLGLGAGAASA